MDHSGEHSYHDSERVKYIAKKRASHKCKHFLGEIEDILSSAGFSSISSIGINEICAVVVGIKRIHA